MYFLLFIHYLLSLIN